MMSIELRLKLAASCRTTFAPPSVATKKRSFLRFCAAAAAAAAAPSVPRPPPAHAAPPTTSTNIVQAESGQRASTGPLADKLVCLGPEYLHTAIATVHDPGAAQSVNLQRMWLVELAGCGSVAAKVANQPELGVKQEHAIVDLARVAVSNVQLAARPERNIRGVVKAYGMQ